MIGVGGVIDIDIGPSDEAFGVFSFKDQKVIGLEGSYVRYVIFIIQIFFWSVQFQRSKSYRSRRILRQV